MFDGTLLAVNGEHLERWDPPAADGGFDLVYPMADMESFNAVLVDSLAAKGYCVVQTLDPKELREATLREVALLHPSYKRLPLEEAEAVLGSTNSTKVLDLAGP